MGESFASGFFRGFAEQSTKDIEHEKTRQETLDDAMKLSAMKISLQNQGKVSAEYAKELAKRQEAAQKDREKESVVQANMKSIRGELKTGEDDNFTADGGNNNQAMPNGIQPSMQTAAPVSPAGSITSSNLPAPQGATDTSGTINPPSEPTTEQVQGPQQPMAQTGMQAVPPAAPLTDTPPTTPEAHNDVPQSRPEFNVMGKQYGLSPMSWIASNAKEYASTTISSRLNNLGVDTCSPDNVKFYAQAPIPQAVLNNDDLRRYASISADKETERQALLKNSPDAHKWYAAHDLTTDGQPMPMQALPKPDAQLWDTTISRPYGKLTELNKYYETANDKINNANSVVFKDIVAPTNESLNKLQYLGTQSSINTFVVSGPAENTQDMMEKFKALISDSKSTLDQRTAAADALMGHLLGLEKREIFSNTKGRVTNQEAQQFFKALPDLSSSQQGRAAIIAYMTGQAAQDLEVSRLKEQYRNDNNGLYDSAHANELAQAYRAANPIFTGKFDPINPSAMFNPNVMSSENWLNSQMGKPINSVDTLRQNLHLDVINSPNNGASNANSGGNRKPDELNSAYKKFGL